MTNFREIPTERHPWQPFLPKNAKVLLLGSFPPPRKLWSMDFYYPNFQNDMWRIIGLIFFDDKNHFVCPDRKAFDQTKIVDFCTEKGIAMYDMATAVKRLNANASDRFLEIVESTNVADLLRQVPACETVVVTGQKAAEPLCEQLACALPTIGNFIETEFCNRQLRFYRMPSSSRAYPLALDKKAAYYKQLFQAIELI